MEWFRFSRLKFTALRAIYARGKAGKWNKKVAPVEGTERETDRVKQWRGKTKRKSNGRLSHGKAGIRFGHKGKRTKATHSKWGKVLAKATFKSKLFVFLSVSWIVFVRVCVSLSGRFKQTEAAGLPLADFVVVPIALL